MRILFDEPAAGRYVVAHKHGESPLRLSRILDGDLAQAPPGRIHRSLPQLLVGHLSETLVPLHGISLVGTLAESARSLFALLLGPAVYLFLASLHKVKRRGGEVYIAVLYQVEHIPEEEGEYQAGYVRTVDIGIGHYYDLVIAQLAEVHVLLASLVLLGHGHSERGVDVAYLLGVESPVAGSLLDVEYLSPQRKYGLGVAVASLLCRSARGITLDQEQLAVLGVPVGTVGELAGHAASVHVSLALHHCAPSRRGRSSRLSAWPPWDAPPDRSA